MRDESWHHVSFPSHPGHSTAAHHPAAVLIWVSSSTAATHPRVKVRHVVVPIVPGSPTAMTAVPVVEFVFA